ncbi:MAG: porin [Methylococcaceae bacterium]|nr:porin [Methylococcaceae bacterium]
MKKYKLLLLTAAVSGLLGGVDVAQAARKHIKDPKDAKIEALERRLRLLEERLEQGEGGKPLAAKTAEAPALKQLDQKVKILERKLEVEKEVAVENAKKAPKLEAGSEGVRFSSADGAHGVRLRGSIQSDGKFFMDDNATPVGFSQDNNIPDRFELRQARIWLEGTLWKSLDFKLMPDFGGGTTRLQDAYIDAHYFTWASLNIGKQKTPISLERLQGDSDGAFLERAFPTYLASNRDIGVVLHGSFARPGETAVYAGPIDFKNFFTYQLGVFNGGGDNSSLDTDIKDDKEFYGRLWAHPFQGSGIAALEGFGIGLGGSWEQPKRRAALPNLVTAIGQNKIVDYSQLGGVAGINKTTALFADGDHYRIYPQAYWYYGPFGLLGEYVLSSQGLLALKGNLKSPVGAFERITQNNSAWQIQVSYVLTGEDNTFQSVKPRQPFSPSNGQWGALQWVARWSELDIDNSSFRTGLVNGRPFQLLDPSKSVSKATSWAVGLNWFVNRNVRFMADYEQTYFQGGAGTRTLVADRPTEKVFGTRFQLAF